MDDCLMRIGEIAAFFNVSVKAMRIYEKMGILKPVKVDEATGYRYYTVDQVKELDALLELRGFGFTLYEIKELLESDMTKERYMEALVRKKVMWQERISLAQDKIDSIDESIEKLSATAPKIKLYEMTEDERAYLLGKMVCVENLHGNSSLSEALWL